MQTFTAPRPPVILSLFSFIFCLIHSCIKRGLWLLSNSECQLSLVCLGHSPSTGLCMDKVTCCCLSFLLAPSANLWAGHWVQSLGGYSRACTREPLGSYFTNGVRQKCCWRKCWSAPAVCLLPIITLHQEGKEELNSQLLVSTTLTGRSAGFFWKESSNGIASV